MDESVFYLLNPLHHHIQEILHEQRYKKDLIQEVERHQGEWAYTPFLKQLLAQMEDSRPLFIQAFQAQIQYVGQLCPEAPQRAAFETDLGEGAFAEWVRHSQQLEAAQWMGFVVRQLEKNALLQLEQNWGTHPQAPECFLAFLAAQVQARRAQASSKKGGSAPNGEVLLAQFESYFELFHCLMEADLQKSVNRWPEAMQTEVSVWELSWEVFQAVIKYSQNGIRSWRAYVRQIIKTRSLNLMQRYSPRSFRLDADRLHEVEPMLDVVLETWVTEQAQTSAKPEQWVPPPLRSKIKWLTPSKKQPVSARQQQRHVHSQLLSVVLEQLRSVSGQSHRNKAEFHRTLCELLDVPLAEYVSPLLAAWSVHYDRDNQVCWGDAESGDQEEWQWQGWYEQAVPEWPQHLEQGLMAHDPERYVVHHDPTTYTQTFLKLLKNRPFEEQFLLKRKAEYKAGKRPKTSKEHGWEHPQRRSYDDILALVRLLPQRYPRFFQWFRFKKTEMSEKLPPPEELPVLSALWEQEYYPQYHVERSLAPFPIPTKMRKQLLHKTRVKARFVINEATVAALEDIHLEQTERLHPHFNRQFENLQEFTQFLKQLMGKSWTETYRDVVADACVLKTPEALCLKRTQARSWAERVMLELRQKFVGCHPETDVQIQDLLVVLNDLDEWAVDAGEVPHNEGDS